MPALVAMWESIAGVVRSAPAQVAIAVIALASFYKNFLERPRLRLLPADTFRLVLGAGNGVTAAHLMCTFVNSGARSGVLQHLEAEITPPGRTPDRFVWDQSGHDDCINRALGISDDEAKDIEERAERMERLDKYTGTDTKGTGGA